MTHAECLPLFVSQAVACISFDCFVLRIKGRKSDSATGDVSLARD